MITGVLLAAGCSQRFGAQKLLEKLPNGQAIGLAAAQTLMAAVDNIIVVIKPDDKALQDLYASENIPTVVCDDAKLGMSASIKSGVTNTTDADGWLIALGDMPFIQEETLRSLVALMNNGHEIVHPSYQQRRGHPVGFLQVYFEELTQLEGDQGAKDILLRHPSVIKVLHCEDKGVIEDIDTTEQLKKYTSS